MPMGWSYFFMLDFGADICFLSLRLRSFEIPYSNFFKTNFISQCLCCVRNNIDFHGSKMTEFERQNSWISWYLESMSILSLSPRATPSDQRSVNTVPNLTLYPKGLLIYFCEQLTWSKAWKSSPYGIVWESWDGGSWAGFYDSNIRNMGKKHTNL